MDIDEKTYDKAKDTFSETEQCSLARVTKGGKCLCAGVYLRTDE